MIIILWVSLWNNFFFNKLLLLISISLVAWVIISHSDCGTFPIYLITLTLTRYLSRKLLQWGYRFIRYTNSNFRILIRMQLLFDNDDLQISGSIGQTDVFSIKFDFMTLNLTLGFKFGYFVWDWHHQDHLLSSRSLREEKFFKGHDNMCSWHFSIYNIITK